MPWLIILAVLLFINPLNLIAGTTPITLADTSLESLYAINAGLSTVRMPNPKANPVKQKFLSAFLTMNTTLEKHGMKSEAWFRKDHIVYFSDYFTNKEIKELTEIFNEITSQANEGATDLREILLQCPYPLLIAKVGTLDSLVKKIKDQHKDVTLFAERKHVVENEQTYSQNPPLNYLYHLEKVHEVLERFNIGPNDSFLGLILGSAAWLHDIVEDTDVTYEQLRDLWGTQIADIVIGVTKLEKQEGMSADQRLRGTFDRTRKMKGSRILKLADRIANVELGLKELLNGRPSKVQKYFSEWQLFKEMLYVPGDNDRMWHHLENLLSNQAYAQDYILRYLEDGKRHHSCRSNNPL